LSGFGLSASANLNLDVDVNADNFSRSIHVARSDAMVLKLVDVSSLPDKTIRVCEPHIRFLSSVYHIVIFVIN